MGFSTSTPILIFEFILLLSPNFRSVKAQTAYQSIFTLDAFAVQQSCVQSCFTVGYANIDCNTDLLGSVIGCPNTPCSKTWAAVDDCYCRGDLQPVAHEWLSSCIDELCTVGDNAVNVANAASIYSGYCTERGFTALPAQNSAETTSTKAGSSSVASTTKDTLSDTTSTSTTSGSSAETSSSSGSSSNNTLTIALAVACGVVVIMALGGVAACWKIRRNKKKTYSNPGNLGPWLSNSSTLPLRPQGGSQVSDGTTEVLPSESASQVGGQTPMMGPSYPHYPVAPSALSSNRAGNNQSTMGYGQSYYRY